MPADDRSTLIAVALRLVAPAATGPLSSLVITIQAPGVSVVVTAAADELRPRSLEHLRLSAAERSILAACAGASLTAKRIAARCRRRCNSYFRGILRSLVKRRLLVRDGDGYRAGELA